MQQCGLTLYGTDGNTFLTSARNAVQGKSFAVRFLLWIEDMNRHVSKGSKPMHQRAANKANIISSELLASLTAEDVSPAEHSDTKTHISRPVIEGAVKVFETLLLIGFGTILWAFYLADFSAESILLFLPVAGFIGVTIPLLTQVNRLYETPAFLQFIRTAPRLAMIWAGIFTTVFVIVFFTKIGAEYSRMWLGGWAVGGFSATFIFRASLFSFLKNSRIAEQLDRRAVLVGGGEPALNLIKSFEAAPARDVSIIGIFDDRGDDRSPVQVGPLKKLGTVDELVAFARQTRVDVLIVTLPLVAETRLLEVLKRLWVLPVDIRLSAYSQKLRYKSRAYSYIGNIPLLDVFDKPLSGWNALLKNIEDKVLASLALVLLSPVMALVALAVKLDSPGPVLFRQKRYGFNNELIEVFKFRSMYVEQSDAMASKLVTRNDPRVTRVGRFIRKTSLDELPQFFNVLRGELSLVGPRPHATHAKAKDSLYTDVVDGYFARHRVKPGITGWAQINGWRGETDTEEKIQRRVEHDLFYIENWSLLFDLYILAKTPFSLIETDNAY